MSKIEWLVKPQLQDDGETITELHWRCTATAEDGTSGAVYGAVTFAEPGDPFVPLAEISLATAQSWVVSVDDAFDTVADVEAAAEARLQRTLDQKAKKWSIAWAG